MQNLAYLSSFEIHVPAFSSAQLALTAASVVPLKRQTEIEGVGGGKGTAGVCIIFLLGQFSIFNDSDEDTIIIYTDYSEQVFLGLQEKNPFFNVFFFGTNAKKMPQGKNRKKKNLFKFSKKKSVNYYSLI